MSTDTTHPADGRRFSIGETLILVTAFSLVAGVMPADDLWNGRPGGRWSYFALVAALALSISGPVLVSWRERLGKERPRWGLGEALWFVSGCLVQSVFLGMGVAALTGSVHGAVFAFILIITLLPLLYLPGNPLVAMRHAPTSWSNLTGMASIGVWTIAVWLVPTG